MYYLPREIVNEDELFGEDPLSRFDEAYGIEMWMETQEGYEGAKELVTRFGLDIQNETSFAVSRRRWDNVVSKSTNLITSVRPQEGDLIFLPLNTKCFQIKHVEHEPVFYQMGALQFYTLSVELFEYAGQRLNTGVAEIDSIETDFSTDIYVDVQLTLEDGLTAIFTEGNERILSEEEDRSDSSATASKDFDTITDSENIYIESEADAIVDFSDADPFSEGGTF